MSIALTAAPSQERTILNHGSNPNHAEIRPADSVDDSVSDTPKGKFPKSAHLLKHADFQRVYQQGRRHFSGSMTVFYLRSAVAFDGAASSALVEGRGVRVGFTCSKALGGAVIRNRLRRRSREAVRHHLFMLAEVGAVDVVINPKKSLLDADFDQISREVERAFQVIRQNRTGAQADRAGGRRT